MNRDVELFNLLYNNYVLIKGAFTEQLSKKVACTYYEFSCLE